MNVSTKYAENDVEGLTQSQLEIRALIRTASTLNLIKENWDNKKSELPEALDKNRLLWTVIAGAVREEGNPQPESIRNNILNLALFIFQRTVSILADPKPSSLEILININMNIAKGLKGDSEGGADK